MKRPKGSSKTVLLIELTEKERQELTRVSKKWSASFREVIRAKIILMASRGLSHREISRRLNLGRPNVRRWIRRYLISQQQDGLDHSEVLFSLVTSSSDSSLSKRLLVPRTIEINLRRGIEERYPAVFRWLSGFKKDIAVKGFAEYEGKRRYFEGIHSSDLNRKNRAIIAGVRWALHYYV